MMCPYCNLENIEWVDCITIDDDWFEEVYYCEECTKYIKMMYRRDSYRILLEDEI